MLVPIGPVVSEIKILKFHTNMASVAKNRKGG
jgi:hypothetical protein